MRDHTELFKAVHGQRPLKRWMTDAVLSLADEPAATAEPIRRPGASLGGAGVDKPAGV